MAFYLPPDDALIIRQTTKGNMDRCAAQLNWIGQEGYVDTFAEPPVFGSVHHYLNCELIKGASVFEVLDEGHIRAVLLTLLRDDYGVLGGSDSFDAVMGLSEARVGEFCSELITAGHTWYRLFWKEEQLKTNIVLMEEILYMPLGETPDGRTIVLRGTPDAVADDPKLWDWKTAARGWKFEKAQFTDQATLYQALVAYNMGFTPWDAEFVVYNRQNGKMERYPTTRTQEQINSALKATYLRGLQLWNLQVNGIQLPATPVVTEYFKEKRGWYCNPKYCPAWNCCDQKFLNDNVDELQVRSLTW